MAKTLDTDRLAAPCRAAVIATRGVFTSGVPMCRIEDLAVAQIRKSIDGNICELPPLPDHSSPAWRKNTVKVLGTQRHLRHLPQELLLKPPMFPRHYRVPDGIRCWVTRLLTGGVTPPDFARLQKDLRFDIDRHTDNLEALRSSSARGWRLLTRGDLVGLYLLATDTPDIRALVSEIVRDHALLLGVVRARLLAEYLRRLATEPMGSRICIDDPQWARRGAIFTDRLVKPAKSVAALVSKTYHGRATDVPNYAVAAGLLASDPRLVGMARRIYQRVGPSNFDVVTTERILGEIRASLAPLTAITPAMLRDNGMSRESFTEVRHGFSAPEGVTILSMNLVALPDRIDAALQAIEQGQPRPVVAPAPPALTDSNYRVCRIATALKAISGCDRHVGDTSTDSNNKAMLNLLRRVHERLKAAEPPHGLAILQISPADWLPR
ncbi:hypothetical protein QCD71_23735 [Sphingomonas sp. PsM26]|nr:hypothetical protein [Sphingomonas sp. PsM26]